MYFTNFLFYDRDVSHKKICLVEKFFQTKEGEKSMVKKQNGVRF